ncbi:MAG TPA: NAD(P)H-dependent oxidoreductase [Roseomonas sp.]|jgi:multimeric flavodoxin WrbA
MKSLLIVYHSNTGATRQMAEAVARGAVAEARVTLLQAAAAGPRAMLDADGYVLATPETLAAIAGPMKDFFDRCYYPLLGRIEGRPYALLVAAGSDGENAIRQLRRIATGWRLRAIAEPILVRTGAQTPDAILAPKTLPDAPRARCEELGAAFAAGLAMGIH